MILIFWLNTVPITFYPSYNIEIYIITMYNTNFTVEAFEQM